MARSIWIADALGQPPARRGAAFTHLPAARAFRRRAPFEAGAASQAA